MLVWSGEEHFAYLSDEIVGPQWHGARSAPTEKRSKRAKRIT